MYADYAFYTDTFYGSAITEADFPRLSSKASDFLDYYTRGKAAAVTDEDTLTALAKACCAIAEQVQLTEAQQKIAAARAAAAVSSAESGKGEYKSESVSNWSATYVTASDYSSSAADTLKAARALYASLAMEYLAGTGLLYRGGCAVCRAANSDD